MGEAVFPPCYLNVNVKLLSPVWPTLCDPMDYILPGSSIHGIFQTGVGCHFLIWGQTTVEVMKIMKIMVTSFKRSHECTATLTSPNSAAGHHQPMPPLETSGHSRASLGQSLVGSLLLSPGSRCTQGSVCALQESNLILSELRHKELEILRAPLDAFLRFQLHTSLLLK